MDEGGATRTRDDRMEAIVRYFDPAKGKWRTTAQTFSANPKREAQKWLTAEYKTLDNGIVPTAVGKQLIASYLDIWLAGLIRGDRFGSFGLHPDVVLSAGDTIVVLAALLFAVGLSRSLSYSRWVWSTRRMPPTERRDHKPNLADSFPLLSLPLVGKSDQRDR
ncbi:MAG: hypothetical protein OEM22_06195 [Acidimicrobiia bacterium]|nr:hypothetical protein [Acidimicrobiia bacterium]MDH3470997.1 hypothetical protein [Acidimicrobiia bacterium]